eukprot:1333496-Rhodomonas_salina.2
MGFNEPEPEVVAPELLVDQSPDQSIFRFRYISMHRRIMMGIRHFGIDQKQVAKLQCSKDPIGVTEPEIIGNAGPEPARRGPPYCRKNFSKSPAHGPTLAPREKYLVSR